MAVEIVRGAFDRGRDRVSSVLPKVRNAVFGPPLQLPDQILMSMLDNNQKELYVFKSVVNRGINPDTIREAEIVTDYIGILQRRMSQEVNRKRLSPSLQEQTDQIARIIAVTTLNGGIIEGDNVPQVVETAVISLYQQLGRLDGTKTPFMIGAIPSVVEEMAKAGLAKIEGDKFRLGKIDTILGLN